MVSKINFDARSVTVEWYERNETKGKEVELDAILALNAHLCPEEQETTASMPKMIKQTSSNPLSRVSSRTSHSAPPQIAQRHRGIQIAHTFWLLPPNLQLITTARRFKNTIAYHLHLYAAKSPPFFPFSVIGCDSPQNEEEEKRVPNK